MQDRFVMTLDSSMGWVVIRHTEYNSEPIYSTQSMTLEECMRKFMLNLPYGQRAALRIELL